MRDLHNNIKASRGLSPKAAVTDNTAFVSEILDCAGFGSAEFIGILGTNTDVNATFAVKMEHADNSAFDSGNEEVDDTYLLGTEALGLDYSSDNKVFKLGYNGPKRYLRVTITPSGNDSGNVFIAGVWIQGHPRVSPQSTQVV